MNHSTIARTLARGIRPFVVAAVAVLLAGPLAVTQPVRADTYAVTNTSNSGPGSLRDAITDANTNPGPDTITFAAATNGVPIVLAGLANENLNASGDLDILDGGDLTIQGNGAAKTIVDGGEIDRVFHVCPVGCASGTTVIFNGVTIQNGKPPVAGLGGGIANQGGTTTVDGCAVISNTALYGGGICNLATLTVQNGSTIGGAGTGNQATRVGGGIFNAGGTTTVDGSTVNANTALYGGGIGNEATLNVRNGSAIGGAGTGNQATDQGGGIYNWTGRTTVHGSTVSANTADEGGGIYNRATLNVTNGSTIGGAGAGNQATENGGGIHNYAGTTTVDGSTVSANRVVSLGLGYGGGIYNKATLTVRNGSTIGGAGAGNQATGVGGDIYNETGGTTVDGSTVSANTAETGGGIYNRGPGTTTVDGSTVSANVAFFGGGISNQGTLDVTNSTIGGAGAGNQAFIWGGGIYNGTGSTTVTGSCILNNRATINGGGLYNDANSIGATNVTGSSIVSNRVTSFFNNQGPEQTATGNWWGAATGPNTDGADSVEGNVDTSGHLTDPILGCLFHGYLPLVQN